MALAAVAPVERDFIPVCEPWLAEGERANVDRCVRTGWISSAGEFIERFEQDWARYCGRAHGVAVSNGTTALQLAVRALGIGPGDEVILPSFTIISCALAITEVGATPVAVDCDPHTWTIDVEAVRAAMSPRTRAIMAVHIYGHPVSMGPLLQLAQSHGVAVIEDAAEAHGATCRVADERGVETWRRCGGFGTVSCFSFYANKIITTGEGGMVLTDDPQLAERVRALRNLCFGKTRRFEHETLGFNYRMTNVQAAIGVAQVARIDELLAAKRALAQDYLQRLATLPAIALPVERPWARNVYWMFALVLGDEHAIDAAEAIARMRAKGIETRPFFWGMHEQPALHALGHCRDVSLPVTEHIARRGFYLPSGMTLSADERARVCDALAEVLR